MNLSATRSFTSEAGSNLLFCNDFDGLVLHSRIKGITRYDKDKDTVYAIAGAGEKWTDFVAWCLERTVSRGSRTSPVFRVKWVLRQFRMSGHTVSRPRSDPCGGML